MKSRGEKKADGIIRSYVDQCQFCDGALNGTVIIVHFLS